MERMLMSKLTAWKESRDRKPLILKGVRQCGKTWLMKELGRNYFEHTAYFNFDFDESLADLFRTTKDPSRLIPQLALLSGVPVKPEKTLIIFDEIQECPEALNALKYFCENARDYPVICAGSLLGVALSEDGFPVGKVQFMSVHPLTFSEFLTATGSFNLSEYLYTVNTIEPIPLVFANPLQEKLKQYFITGGMPGVIVQYGNAYDVQATEEKLQELNDSYEHDFTKHSGVSQFPKMTLLWHSVPSQLARQNKKFLYSAAKEGARAREYEDSLQWLVNAGLLYKIFRIKKPGLPVAAYDDLSSFKLYACDVGVLRRLAKLNPSVLAEGCRLFTEFNGSLTENFVLQSLIPQYDTEPRYWTDKDSRYEVDFIIQHENEILPVEVKAGLNVQSTSMKRYKETYPAHTPLRIRFSLQNLNLDDGVLNIPLYLADRAKDIITLCLENL